MKVLSDRHKKFCGEYLIDGNGTRAYQRVYGVSSPKVAKVNASRLLANPLIQHHLNGLRSKLMAELEINQKRVLEELAAIAFSNLSDILCQNENGEIQCRDLSQIPKETFASIAEVSHRKGQTVLRTHSKSQALKILAEHLGLLSDFNTAIATLRKYGLNLKQSSEGNWIVEVQNIAAD